MTTREQLLSQLRDRGIAVEHHADNARGIPSSLLRHQEDGVYVVSVGGDVAAKDQVGALVDGVAWVAGDNAGSANLCIRIAAGRDPEMTKGVVGAMLSMRASYMGRIDIHIQTETGPGSFAEAEHRFAPVEADPRLGKWNTYLESWYETRPTGLARRILDQDHSESLRLYPQLSRKPADGWSLRLDGLQVGVVGAESGWLRVGKTLTAQKAVQAWGDVHPDGYGTVALTVEDAPKAARLLAALADRLQSKGGLVDHGQPEHSLESAILRGKVAVQVDAGTLELPWQTQGRKERIAWGSQIPTLWWIGGSARYLDALMKLGDTPWAVEMKVAAAGGGYGRYLRQGLTQAILYRHFLRSVHQYDNWYELIGVDRHSCRAALVYPKPPAGQAAKVEPRLRALDELCRDFEVSPVRVDLPGLH